jgi:paraquat-inducible protein A
MTNKTSGLIACHECDLLQREPPLPPGGEAICVRCGAELFRRKPQGLDFALAFLLAAAIVFVFANAYPLMELEASGIRTSATIFDTVRELHESGMTSLAVVVFVTVIFIPALELATLLYLLVPLKLGTVPDSLPLVYRCLIAIRPWGLVEVFMLGALIAMEKLTQIATVYTGVALYAVGVYIMLFAAAEASFEPRALWERAEALRA